MDARDLQKPSVPVAYALLTIELAGERGVSSERLLRGLDIPRGLLDPPDARLSMDQYSRLIDRSIRLTSEPGLGYEFGLRSTLTAHGFMGLGLMSQATLRDAVEFAIRFVRLRTPIYTIRLVDEDGWAAIDVQEAVPFGRLRAYAFDMLLVGSARIGAALLGPVQLDLEVWFDYPEPDYYARYRDRLPPVRFGMGMNCLRFPARHLDLPLEMANPITAKLVTDSCARELELLGGEDFLARARNALAAGGGDYPDVRALAERLFVSERTLKRKLRAAGFSYRELLDEARQRDSIHLLRETSLSVEIVSHRVGYADSANFTRAFRRWTGVSPGAYRANLRGS